MIMNVIRRVTLAMLFGLYMGSGAGGRTPVFSMD